MLIVEYRGARWSLGAPCITSDGCVEAWGTMTETLDGDPIPEEEREGHSFLLGHVDGFTTPAARAYLATATTDYRSRKG